MLRLGCIAFLTGCLLSPATLQAAAIKVTDDTPRHITVAIEDAKVDAVLEDLRKRYGFEVSGLENAAGGEALSATMSGSLQSVIERLLRNWNHMIVRSSGNEGGIAKVMILNATYGAAPRRPGQGRVSGNSDDKLKQALTGAGIEY
jgi:hypothetical protein